LAGAPPAFAEPGLTSGPGRATRAFLARFGDAGSAWRETPSG
jgi:hypothetical protein